MDTPMCVVKRPGKVDGVSLKARSVSPAKAAPLALLTRFPKFPTFVPMGAI
jgi:hypothetical protein